MKANKNEAKWEIGQTLYLVTDPEQYKRIVTGILFLPNNLIMYQLGCGDTESMHYDCEICEDRQVF